MTASPMFNCLPESMLKKGACSNVERVLTATGSSAGQLRTPAVTDCSNPALPGSLAEVCAAMRCQVTDEVAQLQSVVRVGGARAFSAAFQAPDPLYVPSLRGLLHLPLAPRSTLPSGLAGNALRSHYPERACYAETRQGCASIARPEPRQQLRAFRTDRVPLQRAYARCEHTPAPLPCRERATRPPR